MHPAMSSPFRMILRSSAGSASSPSGCPPSLLSGIGENEGVAFVPRRFEFILNILRQHI
jgi:hypothetical protein